MPLQKRPFFLRHNQKLQRTEKFSPLFFLSQEDIHPLLEHLC